MNTIIEDTSYHDSTSGWMNSDDNSKNRNNAASSIAGDSRPHTSSSSKCRKETKPFIEHDHMERAATTTTTSHPISAAAAVPVAADGVPMSDGTTRPPSSLTELPFPDACRLTELHRTVQQMRSSERKILTSMDLDTIDQLGRNHNRSLEERKLHEDARTMAVKQNMLLLLAIMFVVQFVAIMVLIFRGGLTIPNAILFSLYTTTTAGFGSVKIPLDTGFLVFVIIYVFVALAALTTLVAEVYMYLAIQSTAAEKNEDQGTPLRLQEEHDGKPQKEKDATDPEVPALSSKITVTDINADNVEATPTRRYWIIRHLMQIVVVGKSIYRKNELGRVFIVVLYLGSLLLVGSIGMMFLEDWTFTEALYFSTFVMTTVGYGDYAPTNQSSTWFVIFWISSNVSFISIYMGNLSRHYWMFCEANTDRIYRKMLKEYLDKRSDNDDQAHGAHDAGLGGTYKAAISNEVSSSYQPRIQTFQDVYRFVLENAVVNSVDRERLENSTSKDMADLMSFTSTGSSRVFDGRKALIPSFVLLVLVQERAANIIANDVAGCQLDIIAKDSTLVISFDSIRETTRKWFIPRGAEEAFCYAAFEAILYVGECRLVNFGADALLSLAPSDMFNILSPFLAALADNGNMAIWLSRTEELASLQFPRS